VVVVEQGGHLGVDIDDDGAAPPAVAAIGATQRLELLAVNGSDASSTRARAHIKHDAIDERGHGSSWLAGEQVKEKNVLQKRQGAPPTVTPLPKKSA
jgi:hypothetical protein